MKRQKQGVLKDTVILPAGGAVALRINSDNPGVWFFHCHIHIHLLSGLAFVLNEGNFMHSQITQELPVDYPSCEFSGNIQFLRTATCFCNATAVATKKHFHLTKKPVHQYFNDTINKEEDHLVKKCSSISGHTCDVLGN